jgi:hypothetical protein
VIPFDRLPLTVDCFYLFYFFDRWSASCVCSARLDAIFVSCASGGLCPPPAAHILSLALLGLVPRGGLGVYGRRLGLRKKFSGFALVCS